MLGWFPDSKVLRLWILWVSEVFGGQVAKGLEGLGV